MAEFINRSVAPPSNLPPEVAAWVSASNDGFAQFLRDLQETFDNVHTLKQWTPVLTFATPGDVSVSYSIQLGYAAKVRRTILLEFAIQATVTHTTASGDLQVTGSPYTTQNVTNYSGIGGLSWSGITKANYTDIEARIQANSSIIVFDASGSGQARDFVTAANVPSGGTVVLRGTLSFTA